MCSAYATGAAVVVWAPIAPPAAPSLQPVAAGGAPPPPADPGAPPPPPAAAEQEEEEAAEWAGGTVQPTGGPIHGGTMVRMVTATLPDGLAACCVFGSIDTGATCIPAIITRGFTAGSDQVACPAPAATAAGAVDVGLSLNGGVDTNPMGTYVYTNLLLATLTPLSAVSLGGTLLTIGGSGFLTDGISPNVARCRFTYEVDMPTSPRGPTNFT